MGEPVNINSTHSIQFHEFSNSLFIKINKNISFLEDISRIKSVKFMNIKNENTFTYLIDFSKSDKPNIRGHLLLNGNIKINEHSLDRLRDLNLLGIDGGVFDDFKLLRKYTIIPPANAFTKLQKLTSLDIINTNATDFDFLNITNLKKLEVIDFSNNELTKFPSPVKTLIMRDQIVELDLSDNNIQTLPDEIFHSKTLQAIDLRGNPIKKIPKGLYNRLANLRMFEEDKEFIISLNSPHLPDYANVDGFLENVKEPLMRYFDEHYREELQS